MPEHEHAFKPIMHMDGCHWYSWTGRCSCGATIHTRDERDLKSDPYSAVWMEDVGGPDSCERCKELMDGAEPQHQREVVLP